MALTRHTHIFIVLIVIAGVLLFIGGNSYIKHKQQADTETILKIVFDSYYNPDFADIPDGSRLDAKHLRSHLILSTQKTAAIGSLEGYLHSPDTIHDVWSRPIYAVKSGNGLRLRSDGPDGLPYTPDDIEYR